jgi:hypothetical protein
MRILSTLLIAAGMASAGTTYTATPLNPPGSTIGFANVIALNNKGEVLGDACPLVGGFLNCGISGRGPAVWGNGAFTPLPIPSGYSYIAQPAYYGINDSSAVVGTLANSAGTASHVFLWTNGVPSPLLDAPVAGACAPASSTCTCKIAGSSNSFGLNAAGHILGSTTYPSYVPGGQACSSYWVWDGSKFLPPLPYPEPLQCVHSPGGGTGIGFPSAFNDADVVLQTVDNFFCGPPFFNPTPPFPGSLPVLIQNLSYSFLPEGSFGGWVGTSINDVGDVLGYWSSGTGRTDVVVLGNGILNDLGPSGYAHMNNAGQVIYSPVVSGLPSGINIWQNGVSTPVILPASINPATTAYVSGSLNDAGQFTVSGGLGNYLLTPSGPCAQDVTFQVQITRTGFRYNHSTGLFALIGSVTNTSGAPIPGPISLVVDNLPASATLYGITGDTLCAAPQGRPYINIGNIGSGGSLAPGATISGAIDFIDIAKTGITFNFRVLAGPGGR